MDRISICSTNLARHKREPILDHLVTGSGKWTVCKHVVRENAYIYKGKAPPSTSKAGVHHKVMLCYRRNSKGIVNYELLISLRSMLLLEKRFGNFYLYDYLHLQQWRNVHPCIRGGQTDRNYAESVDNAGILRAEKTVEANCKEARTLRGALKPLKRITMRKRKDCSTHQA
ncbi:hypothetical protein TNCV_2903771 [Trichonephila clavipes]|nr:hypothetical protein TNCV_2903771 [Trichonephila clavipes]